MFKNFVKFVVRQYYKIIFKVKINGLENIPTENGYVLAPNHISIHDPLIIGSFFPNELSALAKKRDI